MSGITINNLSKSFGDVQVLRDFSVELQDGEFITLLGPSGCGKTTILRMIAGFEKPNSGEIYIDDILISNDKTFVPPEKRKLGMVFQSYAVWPHMNVFDNVAYPLKTKKEPSVEIKTKVEKVLKTVHLDKYAKRIPSELSGGQQQRVALARALVAKPRLLLLDEPLSNLDAKLREAMRFEIKDIQTNTGITVVYVTHDQTEAMTMSDRVIVLNSGIIQQIGTPSEIYETPANPFVASFVGKINFLDGVVENNTVHIKEAGQALPYDGDLSGEVLVGIRPEHIKIEKDENGSGFIKNIYYMGESCDIHINFSGKQVRMICPSALRFDFNIGDKIKMICDDFLVFEKTDIDFDEILT